MDRKNNRENNNKRDKIIPIRDNQRREKHERQERREKHVQPHDYDERLHNPNRETPNNEKPSKKKKGINRGAATLGVLIILAIIFLLGPMGIRLATGNVQNTDIFRNGVVEESISTEAVVIRSEEVQRGEMTGIAIPTYREGERVPRGANVATVIDAGSSSLVDQIRSLNVRISQARDNVLNNSDFVNEEIRRIDEEIESNINDFSNIHRSADLTKYLEIHRNIEILMDQRQDLQDSDDNVSSSYLRQLEAQKAELESAMSNRVENITSSQSGLVSYVVDGFEAIYTPSILETMTTLRLSEIKSEIRSGSSNNIDNYHAKIITDINYFLVSSVSSEDIRNDRVQVGSMVNIRINDKNMIVNMEVYNIRNEGDTAIVVFRAERALEEMTDIRLANIDIIIRQVRGIRVPIRALSNVNYREMNARMTLVRSGYEHHVGVRILIIGGNYAIVENLRPGEEISIELNGLYIL